VVRQTSENGLKVATGRKGGNKKINKMDFFYFQNLFSGKE
jgi:hypothetical protein